MRKLFILYAFFILNCAFFGQPNSKQTDAKSELSNFDLSNLWTQTENRFVYGFIGSNYQRIRVKFTDIIKDTSKTDGYIVHGKSMVKSNVNDFKGRFKILHVWKYQPDAIDLKRYKSLGIKDRFTLQAEYQLAEDTTQNHSGAFTGTFSTQFCLSKSNKIVYDKIEFEADGYTNNEFVGKWTDYKTKVSKRCNWGDYRIPNTEKFDIGAGEFSPADKYLKYGWQTVRDTWNGDKKIQAKAKAIEEAKWWK